MNHQVIALRYAKGLFLSLDKNDLEEVEEQLADFSSNMEENSDLKKVFEDPAISIDKKSIIVSNIARISKFNKNLTNFLLVVLSKNRMALLININKLFIGLIDEYKNRLRLIIKSVAKIDPSYLEEIKEALSKNTGKSIVAQCVIDKNLLGGIRLETPSIVFDASIAAKLASLKNNFLNQIR
jgi:F-type H+-transporting ATPase subunit delta